MSHRYSLDALSQIQATLWPAEDSRSLTSWHDGRIQVDELSVDALRVTGDMILDPAPGVADAMRIRCKELEFFEGGRLVLRANLILYAERAIGAVKIKTSSSQGSAPGDNGRNGAEGHVGLRGKPGKKGANASMFSHSKTGKAGGSGGNGTDGTGGGDGEDGEDGASAFSLRAYFGSFASGASVEIQADGSNGAPGGNGGAGGGGGAGGDGGPGGTGGDGFVGKTSGNGGAGGPGGTGGNGGRGGAGGTGGDGGGGGKVLLGWPTGVAPKAYIGSVKPGNAGLGGAAGQGGRGGDGGQGGPMGHPGPKNWGDPKWGPAGKDGAKGRSGTSGVAGHAGAPGRTGELAAMAVPVEDVADWLLATLRLERRVRLEQRVAGPLDDEAFFRVVMPLHDLAGRRNDDELALYAEGVWAQLPADVTARMRAGDDGE